LLVHVGCHVGSLCGLRRGEDEECAQRNGSVGGGV
jgi:hypothetical protein